MKGYFAIEIPTKKYIKAYIHHQLGEQPIINHRHRIGNTLHDLLTRDIDEIKPEFPLYNSLVKVYIPHHTFFHRGGNISETNIKKFNLFVEEEIKTAYRMLMDFLIELHPSFEANLPKVREKIGIDMEAWDTDSIKKDYYRYRKRSGKPLLYKKPIPGMI